MDPARVAAAMFDSESRTFAVRLWDGTLLPPPRDEGVRGAAILRDPGALDALVPPAAERRLAEAVLDGRIELEGDAIGLVEAAARWSGPRPHPALAAAVAGALARRALHAFGPAPLAARLHGGRHSLRRDRDAVQHHYDVSDAFYRLFLGDDLVYSCAYFPTGREALEEAQRAKLELVCRKLALAPGERFLDVGCGWGALVEHAGVHHGVRATGITLSEHQLGAARARAERLRGRAEVAVRLEDYRTLRADVPFDKVASIGMMEHVGRARLDAYFAAVNRLLRPGGLFLNHAIAAVDGWGPTLPWAGQRGGGFIWRYVFPDGELLPIAEVIARAARAGFEVRDLECLREHYAQTLAAWLARLEARYAEAVALVGERRARLYRLYLAASAAGFRLGRITVFQLLLARPDAQGRAAGLPHSRGAWYAERAPGRTDSAAG
jgi:cyclopropane-fatty-acyl-phospholipid synthase